jgi:hypothetical protein
VYVRTSRRTAAHLPLWFLPFAVLGMLAVLSLVVFVGALLVVPALLATLALRTLRPRQNAKLLAVSGEPNTQPVALPDPPPGVTRLHVTVHELPPAK